MQRKSEGETPAEITQNYKDMGRKPNDGRGRLGGRAKGTPNKDTAQTFEEWQAATLSENRRKFKQAMRESDSDNALLAYALLSLADAIRGRVEERGTR